MKAAVLAFALLSSCALAVHAGSARQLFQAPASAPSSCPTVFDIATEHDLTTFVDLLTLDKQEPFLGNSSNPLSYTVFAPTNEAISSYLQENDLTAQRVFDTGRLDPILQYHFIIYPYTESELVSQGTVGTNYLNETLSFSAPNHITAFDSAANITQANIKACSSIIHIIDGVLIPDLSHVGAPSPGPSAASS